MNSARPASAGFLAIAEILHEFRTTVFAECLQQCLHRDTVPLEMATELTTTIAVRVPVDVKRALEEDAEDFGRTVGQHLREMLVSRYSGRKASRNPHIPARNTDEQEKVAFDG